MSNFVYELFPNESVSGYLIVVASLLITLSLVRLAMIVIIRIVSRADEKHRLAAPLLHSTYSAVLKLMCIVFLYVGIGYFKFAPHVLRVIHAGLLAIALYFVIRFLARCIELFTGYERLGQDQEKRMKGAMFLVRIFLWTMGIIFFLDNQGYNVSSIVAGLGIGGIAVALAAQNILGDLFNYFVILFDRPVEVGDFIILDDKKGTIEFIGIKTTRLKSLEGEQIIISNSDLTKSRLHNYKRMNRRRVSFRLQISLIAQGSQLRLVSDCIGKIINDFHECEFNRATFVAIGPPGYEFEVVYFLQNPDYDFFARIHQEINLKIVEEFEHQGIKLAAPYQDIRVIPDGDHTLQSINLEHDRNKS